MYFQELQSVQGQLVAERSRCFNLEVKIHFPIFEVNSCFMCVEFEYIGNVCFQAKISELQKLLESMQSVEDQVQALRQKKSAFDQEIEHAATAQRQSSGGVWRLFGGSEK